MLQCHNCGPGLSDCEYCRHWKGTLAESRAELARAQVAYRREADERARQVAAMSAAHSSALSAAIARAETAERSYAALVSKLRALIGGP